jgi:hypothetical protein
MVPRRLPGPRTNASTHEQLYTTFTVQTENAAPKRPGPSRYLEEPGRAQRKRMTEQNLIESFRSGDEFAFVGLYNRYKGPVYAFC